jgi:hypothetical protein
MQAQRPTFYIDCRKIKLRFCLLLLFCAIVLHLLVYHGCFQDGKLCLFVANDKLGTVSNFWCSRTVSKVYSKLIDYYNNFYVDRS